MDVVRGSAWGNAAGAVQEIDDRLGSLIRHDALEARNLSDQVKLLALVLGHAHPYPSRRHSGDVGQEAVGVGAGRPVGGGQRRRVAARGRQVAGAVART